MKRSVFVTLLVLIMLPVVVLPILTAPSGVVMIATIAAPNEQGSIKIPNAGVDASLSYIHVDCECCFWGLWNGGRINGDAQMFESVKVGHWADIKTPECHLVAECVDIVYAVEGFIRANSDVLVCVKTAFPLVMRVYRFVVL